MHEDQLRYFLSAARCGSFSAAARECYVAQPTVSRQIAALEQELGAPLFLRAGRHLTLTATGQEVARKFDHLIEGWVKTGGDGLTDEERTDFYRSLSAITENLRARIDAEVKHVI